MARAQFGALFRVDALVRRLKATLSDVQAGQRAKRRASEEVGAPKAEDL